ncbi:MAG TPA: M23 family metallopeptidase, partial [Ilumatobacteraceae bacterium]|nr:M23 family metallopeptidase [Ilumatobacteraceae bacterium]
LLNANNATTSTALYPGMVLCLPTSVTTTSTAAPVQTGSISIRQFPVQGPCSFIDTYGAPRSGGRTHEGVDIIAKTGQYVYAAEDGTLTKQYLDAAGSLSGNGWRLTRADGTYFFYAHLSAFASGLKVGSTVKSGQILGLVGMTGNAGTPHLHFEVHPGGGASINPTPVVRAVNGCGTSVVPPQPGTSTTTTTAPATTAAATTAPATTAPATTAPATSAPTTTVPGGGGGPPAASRWQFIAPVTALDTGSLPAGQATTVRIDTLAGVGANAPGAMVRLLARDVATTGYLTVHACAAGTNGTSTLNVTPGRLNATMTLVPVAAGAFCVTSSVTLGLRIDVVGYQSTEGSGVEPLNAKRAIDTRLSGRLSAGGTRTLSPAALGTPLGSKAVTATITILNPSGAGSLGIGPCGGTPWIVGFTSATAQTFSAIVRTNDAGVCVTSTAAADVVIDVDGVWGSTGLLATTTQRRVFDSRQNGTIPVTGRYIQTGLSASTPRAQFTITIVAGSTSGALLVWNCMDTKPTASVAYAPAGTTSAATVTLSTSGGALCLAGTTELKVVLDVVATG